MTHEISFCRFHFLFDKKEIEIKMFFSHLEQKQKCSLFTFIQYIQIYVCTYDFYSEQCKMKLSLCYNKSLWFTNPQTRLSKCVSDRYTFILGYLEMYHTYQFDTHSAHLKDSPIVNFSCHFVPINC